MELQLGPILSFDGLKGSSWCLSVVVASVRSPGSMSVASSRKRTAIKAERIFKDAEVNVYRYKFSVPIGARPSNFAYSVAGKSYEVALPGKATPNIAYASCNGFSSLKYMKNIADNNAVWKQMRQKHEAAPYHLLLLGGDQVYADSMWETVPTLKAWAQLGWEEGNAALFSNEMERELKTFYSELYCDRWSQEEVAYLLARIPMISMWDDHDIVDGWGSYPVGRQNSEVFKGIGRIATQAFAIFQQQLVAGEKRQSSVAEEHGFSRGLRIGVLGILVLDMRSERTNDQVLSRLHWDKVFNWLDAQEGLEHLFVMSSIPVVYPGFDTLEQMLGAMPGYQDLEDDLRDHWNSRPHKGERIRLINRLLGFTRTKKVRTTILSGDVHVAALGTIEAQEPDGDIISVEQLIASGIVHPSPNAVVLFCLKHLFSNQDELEAGIIAKMVEFPGHQARFIGRRNYLSLEPDDQGRIWANWIVEGEAHPYTKVLHPNRMSARWAAR